MQGISYALLAAVLFGISTPISKWLVADIPPVMLAGLFYLGSGLGLGLLLVLRKVLWQRELAWPHRTDLPSLVVAISLGGIAAPVLLMSGLQYTSASSSALLLNLESVFTALFAWIAFKENVDRRIAVGMLAIVIASALLSWNPQTRVGLSSHELFIVVACICWAADNNFTRKISHGDAMLLASLKGIVAGGVNLALYGLGSHQTSIDSFDIASAMTLGWLGYGISLSLFVLALRHLGAARTGAYFSIAPFVGAATAIVFLHEQITVQIVLAGGLMALGVWLHLTERHEHEHAHEFLEHAHAHTHDAHHQHEHPFPWTGEEPHTHVHQHEPLIHCHPHYPDIHHQHKHG